MITAKFNYLDSSKRIKKIWNQCIGSCHAYTLLRADLREQLKIAHEECGFKYIRFHGIFMDQMNVVDRDYNGNLVFSFYNIDNIYDYILSIGMKPFIELSFMPEALASSKHYVFRYKGNTTIPKSYAEWDYFIKSFTNHLIERYGKEEVESWYFEVWNEPNLGGDIYNLSTGFFFGTQKDYFELYAHTALAIKSVDNGLNVGGPATSNNRWIKEFINYVKSKNLPLDFISTHHYPSDVLFGDDCKSGEEFKSLQEDLKNNKAKEDIYAHFDRLWKYIPKFSTIKMSEKARIEAENYPLLYTEQSSLSGLDSDGEFGASYIVEINLRNMFNVDCYSYWCLSDIFEEGFQKSIEFCGAFGLFTYHGIKKAPYNAFALLNKLDGNLLDHIYEENSLTIRVIKSEVKDYILITNYDSLAYTPIKYNGIVALANYVEQIKEIKRYIIDENHSNSLRIYQNKKYQSQYLSVDEINELKKHDDLFKEDVYDFSFKENNLMIPFDIKGQAVILFEITK